MQKRERIFERNCETLNNWAKPTIILLEFQDGD